MSIDTTTSVEITPNIVETSIQASEDIVTSNTHEVCTQELNSLVDVVKKEYAIVGDALFASVEANETPYWLSVLIDNTVDNAIATGLSDYNALRQDVANAIASIDVASNAYVEKINFDSDVDSRITSRLTTLDATYQAQFATKVELTTAVANTESALAQDIANLSVSFNNDLTTQVNNITTAYAAADASIASDITALQSSFASQAGDISANASTLSGLQTFVGVDSTNLPNGTGLNSIVTSHSTAFTNLENSVTGPSGDVAYSLSNLEQRSAAYADTEGARVENKFSYNSTINLNGQFHEAGFGIGATGSGTGTELDPFKSEFWINAEKFKFTNTNQTGQAAPFTIDASGVTPQVTFNGIVSFANTNMDAYDNNLVSISYSDLNGKDTLAQQLGYADYTTLQASAIAGNTLVSGGYLNTTLIDSQTIVGDQILAGSVNGDRISANTINGDRITANSTIYSPYISGGVITGVDIIGSRIFTGSTVYYATEAGDPYYYDANNAGTGHTLGESSGNFLSGTFSTGVVPYYSYNANPTDEYFRYEKLVKTFTAYIEILGVTNTRNSDWYNQKGRLYKEGGVLVAETNNYNGGTLNLFDNRYGTTIKTGTYVGGPLGNVSWVLTSSKLDLQLTTPWTITIDYTLNYSGDDRLYHSFVLSSWNADYSRSISTHWAEMPTAYSN